ncbi:Triphosphoribosyl-dephospho-CoA synthetase [uncultured Rubrobacteraceae bacterium]|uniref:Triphosphoribosyl-dephospho-CoA synthetase n=1 Tax=uncultured Rubrobacteraceae bacterium TaxID=349277 RepID=A0A6J4PUV1_9ACTN|nr:Triphosphoribosyl-dephospho-CoA synthetase [uncultured Rubrobacteraceae bacterium]
MERPSTQPVPESVVAASAATAMTLVYSAPTPGTGSRYLDGRVAHESKVLSVVPVREALAGSGRRGVGETVLEATLSSRALTGFADPRCAGYLAPLSRAALRGESSARVLAGLGHEEISPFARALEAGGEEVLAGALSYALGAGKDATLSDAMRFSAGRQALAREYARDFEVTRELARPALLSALSRADSVRGALVQAYLEVLAEVPDLDVVGRAGRQEAEEVSRMAHGVLKAGGVHSRRGLEGTANLGGLLRAEPRLSPTTTEYPVIAAAFLVALEYGAEALSHRLAPARGVGRGR